MQWLTHAWWSADSRVHAPISVVGMMFLPQAPFHLAARWRRVSPFLKALSGWLAPLPFLPLKRWGSWRAHMPSKPFLIMLSLLPSSSPCLTCPASCPVFILLPAYFSWSGLHSRCSSKCFHLSLFTILLQNSNCTLLLPFRFSKNILHSSHSTSVETVLFSPGHVCTSQERMSHHAFSLLLSSHVGTFL